MRARHPYCCVVICTTLLLFIVNLHAPHQIVLVECRPLDVPVRRGSGGQEPVNQATNAFPLSLSTDAERALGRCMQMP